MDGTMPGPLHGTTIIEFAALGPVPFAGMLLSDLGAEITRIDRTGGNPTADPRYAMNRGRRSVALDVKSEQGRAVALDLVERADVLLEGHRPGVMERLGLGPADCWRRNDRLVYGRMTGWGQEGPLAQTAGHDINYIALSGALSTAARAGERPVPPVNLLGDFGGGGTFLALGVLAALIEVGHTATGQVVDAAMVDGTAVLTTMLHGLMAQGRWRDEPGTNFADTGAPFYEVYTCRDGRHVAVGALERPFYEQLVAGLGLDPDALPDRGDEANWPMLKDVFSSAFASRTRDEWARVFEATDACVTPVLSLAEAPRHPHNIARGTFVEQHGVIQPAPAPRYPRAPAATTTPPATIGADTDEVLAQLGYDEHRRHQLRASGIVR